MATSLEIFNDAGNFRMKLALSFITLKPVRILNIRHKSTDPGVDQSELSLFRMIGEISNGSVIKINDTGTIVTCKPGILTGGTFELDCEGVRGIGYFVEFLLALAPFCKNPIEATLHGVTNTTSDPSLDMIKAAWLPIYRSQIGAAAASGLKIEITKRGVAPKGGGTILFQSKPCSAVLPISRLIPGKVTRIRGIAWTCRVSSAYGHKLMSGAKTLLNQVLSDVYITLDHRKGDAAGLSPGFGITLWAETKDEVVFSAESMSEPESPNSEPVDAESIGKQAASHLLHEIYQSGCVDSGAQSLALLLMACESGRNASQLAIGPPSSYTIANLRLIRSLLGVTFHFSYNDAHESDVDATAAQSVDHDSSLFLKSDSQLIATCFGAGVQNIARAIR